MTTPTLLLRYSQDIPTDTRMLARYIGNLEGDRSKVSVNSALSVKDNADYFRFRMTDDGEVRIRTGELVGAGDGTSVAAPDGTVRYQLLSPSGAVMADSNPNSGKAFAAWRKFVADDNLSLGKGQYTIKVARDKAALNNQEYIYSFTLRSAPTPITNDTPEMASREFLTTERPADPSAAGYDSSGNTNVTAVLGLFADVTVI